jgi:hypothetical protein
MRPPIKLILLWALSATAAPAAIRKLTQTKCSGPEDGYHTYRIPALITTKGTLLAFCEGGEVQPAIRET